MKEIKKLWSQWLKKRTKKKTKLIINEILTEGDFLLEVMEKPEMKKFLQEEMKKILNSLQKK